MKWRFGALCMAGALLTLGTATVRAQGRPWIAGPIALDSARLVALRATAPRDKAMKMPGFLWGEKSCVRLRRPWTQTATRTRLPRDATTNSRTNGASAAALIACVCFGTSATRAPAMVSPTARTAAFSDAGLFPPPTTSVGTRIARRRDAGSSKSFMILAS